MMGGGFFGGDKGEGRSKNVSWCCFILWNCAKFNMINQLKACRDQMDKSEVKLEVSSIYRIFRCNSIQN